ncbi:MAG TPA: hypothetical protein VE262_09335 [Blastocatellia bacterium]|nr:hypothetical protein [Blastocatellia bacterium]
MWKYLMLSIVLAACRADVLGATGHCQSPDVQVPQTLARQIVQRLIKDETPDEQEQLIRDVEDRIAGMAGLFCAEAIDLDKDGRQDLLIRLYSSDLPGCGTANCSVWAYRRTAEGYELLLEGWGVVPIIALKTSTNGHLDLKTVERLSGVKRNITVYKFDSRQYRARECISRTYVEDDEGKGRGKPKRRRCDLE